MLSFLSSFLNNLPINLTTSSTTITVNDRDNTFNHTVILRGTALKKSLNTCVNITCAIPVTSIISMASLFLVNLFSFFIQIDELSFVEL